ncbi:unnamed protein product, partial [Ectocarpus sp. 13 AM-2016]
CCCRYCCLFGFYSLLFRCFCACTKMLKCIQTATRKPFVVAVAASLSCPCSLRSIQRAHLLSGQQRTSFTLTMYLPRPRQRVGCHSLSFLGLCLLRSWTLHALKIPVGPVRYPRTVRGMCYR